MVKINTPLVYIHAHIRVINTPVCLSTRYVQIKQKVNYMKRILRIYPLITFVLLLLNSTIAWTQTKGADEINIVNGLTVDRLLSSSEKHIYTIELKNGYALEAEIKQESVDVVIDVFDSEGVQVSQIDGNGEIEIIDITSTKSGVYRLIVYPYEKDGTAGNYQLKVNDILSLDRNVKRITKSEILSNTLYNLWESSLTKTEVIDDFVKSHKDKHIIEPINGNDEEMMVTYFCLPDEGTEYAMESGGPDFLGLRFQQLGKTKLYFTSHRVPKDARFNYGFNYFKLYSAGPNNEVQYRKIEHVYDGTVVMPEAPKQPYASEREGVERGELKVTSLKSKFLKEDRKITVYTPAWYNEDKPHNLLIIFDGVEYGANPDEKAPIPAPTILDNLNIEGEIEPTIAVFVWNMGNRGKDLISDDFSNFVAIELIEWTRKNYNIYPESDHVIVAGSSRGGFAASSIALNHSASIGKVLSQSGSYWIKGINDENHWMYPTDEGKLITAYKRSPRLPIQFYMDVGIYDAGAGMLGMNREFRTILELKGYTVDYHEFKGGHSYVNWCGTLANGLISLIGKN
jgi:enterochelin esterase-like enzyme